jgi:hypothetical protein
MVRRMIDVEISLVNKPLKLTIDGTAAFDEPGAACCATVGTTQETSRTR